MDNLLKHGTDRYGDVHSPMLMNIIDVRTNESPSDPDRLDIPVRHEGRAHRRCIRGSNLWADQPTLRAMYAFSKLTGDPRYATAADAYVKYTFEHCRKSNGLVVWGSHIFWDCFADSIGGDPHQQHETCVNRPVFEQMFKVVPARLTEYVDLVWEWHVVDQETGETNRHDDKHRGLDFSFCQSVFVYGQAFMYGKTGNPEYLRRAKILARRHWNTRNQQTNLTAIAPAAALRSPPRFDGLHCSTDLLGSDTKYVRATKNMCARDGTHLACRLRKALF